MLFKMENKKRYIAQEYFTPREVMWKRNGWVNMKKSYISKDYFENMINGRLNKKLINMLHEDGKCLDNTSGLFLTFSKERKRLAHKLLYRFFIDITI